MATLNIRLSVLDKQMLERIAEKENRTMTKEVIQLIEDRFNELIKEVGDLGC